jgi:hypothetical protein
LFSLTYTVALCSFLNIFHICAVKWSGDNPPFQPISKYRSNFQHSIFPVDYQTMQLTAAVAGQAGQVAGWQTILLAEQVWLAALTGR